MITRLLEFTDSPEGRDRFAMIYQGFNAGGSLRYVRDMKTMQVTRLECRILDRFDLISEPAPEGTPNALLMRSLKTGEGTQRLELEETEYKLLVEYFDSAAGAWVPLASRQVVATADWLMGIAHRSA